MIIITIDMGIYTNQNIASHVHKSHHFEWKHNFQLIKTNKKDCRNFYNCLLFAIQKSKAKHLQNATAPELSHQIKQQKVDETIKRNCQFISRQNSISGLYRAIGAYYSQCRFELFENILEYYKRKTTKTYANIAFHIVRCLYEGLFGKWTVFAVSGSVILFIGIFAGKLSGLMLGKLQYEH